MTSPHRPWLTLSLRDHPLAALPLPMWLQRGALYAPHHDALDLLLEKPTGSPPAGRWLRLGHDLPVDGRYLVATPVAWYADRQRVIARQWGASLAVSSEEQLAIATAFNHHFAADGLQLTWHDHHASLRIPPDLPLPPLPPLSALASHSLNQLQPAAHWRHWQRLTSEMQMLLYALPLNRQREAARQLPINGLWCWGDDQQPPLTAAAWRWIYSDQPLLRGAASDLQIPLVTQPALRQRGGLVAVEGGLEQQLWPQIFAAARWRSLTLYAADATLYWRPWHHLYLWRTATNPRVKDAP
jgi:hypothetical protein